MTENTHGFSYIEIPKKSDPVETLEKRNKLALTPCKFCGIRLGFETHYFINERAKEVWHYRCDTAPVVSSMKVPLVSRYEKWRFFDGVLEHYSTFQGWHFVARGNDEIQTVLDYIHHNYFHISRSDLFQLDTVIKILREKGDQSV